MVEKDEYAGNQESPKRRGRLFGGRRRRNEPELTPTGSHEETPTTPASTDTPAGSADAPAAPADPAEAPSRSAPEPAQPAPAQSAPATTAPVPPVVDAPALPQPLTSPVPVVGTQNLDAFAGSMSTTTLLFQAPPVLPEAAFDEPDEPEEPAGGRKRRRRGGNGGGEASDDQPRQRQKPKPEPELITEPQKVKGSTRLEAKKQRRRDGRDAGRRRAVITEAEFLARREAVDRTMVVRSRGGRIQIGVLEDKVLVEHYVAKSQEASLIGNVYLGKVQNVLPSMEAAFVDIGRGRNAVLYSGEVDWEAAQAESGEKNQPRRIELALKPGDKVLVQVTKDPVGHKGARLTSQISLPGRYLVYVPGGSMNGISRKLPDTERARLKKILKEVLPEGVGVIVRTAAEGATEEQLKLDVTRLTAQWAEIQRAVEKVQAPALLHSEPDLLIKIVRDVFNEDFQRLVIQGDDAQQTIETYLGQVAPDLLDRVERYAGDKDDAFDEFRISEQIEKALDRKVWLPSGGSLIIDRTEAMTVIDVNTGKFVGSGGNLEETVTKNNLEAAEEIVRQLRLRDIGGIIVVDFIDMVLESNRDLVLRRLVECLSRDRTKHQVAEVTSLGLVQMTRKKLGLGLLETFSEPCEVCAGRGVIVHHDPVVKHRAQQPERGSSRRRGGNGNGSGNGNSGGNGGAPVHEGTHQITEEVKSSLARIAASTIGHPTTGQVAVVTSETTATTETTESSEPAREAGPADDRTDETRPRRSRSRRARSSGTDAGAQPADEASVAPAPVAPLVDLPPVPAREPREIDREAAAHLLDSVLEALPPGPGSEAPAPSRPRRRRVTTSALSGTIVTPEEPRPGDDA
ncbi:Rne/Rng family ribonuclease [Gryllotalpicola ginsengisoli]|uniref:Rne/Rng family ribonuclease n=1 Tax=Gryllotalpicola ginsengisoli TaxID=444608 RepID=UPI0003B65F5F|nr:Rne/Rng family ribonuclease [Gryllotalpicola ginsengisoli]